MAATRGRRISIVVDSTGINRAVRDLNEANQAGNRLVSVFKGIGGALKDAADWVWRYRYRIGAAVSALVGVATVSYTNLEEHLARVKVATGATAGEIESLNALANRIGTTTSFSATEAGIALEGLASAGLDVAQSAANLPHIFHLAGTAGLDVASAVGVAKEAMIAFRISADQLGPSIDVLAKGAFLAKMPLSEVVGLLSYIGPLAGDLGMTLTQTMGLVGVLGQAGLGANATYALRSMLMTFSDLREKKYGQDVEEVFSKLHLSVRNVVRDIQGGKMDLVGFAGLLRSTGATASDLATVFDRRTAMAILAIGDAAKTAYPEVIRQLEGATGYAEKSADTLDDTLGNTLKGIKNSWQSLGNVLMGAVAPSLKEFLDEKYRPFVNDLVSIWSDKNLTMAQKWDATMAGLAPAAEKALQGVVDAVTAMAPSLAEASAEFALKFETGLLKGILGAFREVPKSFTGGLSFDEYMESVRETEQLVAAQRRIQGLGQDLAAAVDQAQTGRAPSAFFSPGELTPYLSPFGGGLSTLSIAIDQNTQAVTQNTSGQRSSDWLSDLAKRFSDSFWGAFTPEAFTSPITSTLISAVTEPITSSLEKELDPTSRRLGKLTDTALHVLDVPLSFLNAGLDALVDIAGGPAYTAGRYTAEGTYGVPLFAGAGAQGGTVLNAGGVRIDKLEIVGVRDGQDAADKTIEALATYEQMSSRNMARQIQRGSVKAEAAER